MMRNDSPVAAVVDVSTTKFLVMITILTIIFLCMKKSHSLMQRIGIAEVINNYVLNSVGGNDFYMESSDEVDRAVREESAMSLAQRLTFKQIPDISSAKMVNELILQGVARLDNLLTSEEVEELLVFVKSQWGFSVQKVPDLNVGNNYFSNSKAQSNRWC